jgi:glyoxylase-like metal-dependent hydrolase (beta-lactamase superfamily II)
MGFEHLTGNVYRLLLGRFQAYLWREDSHATLIDTGPADAGGEIAAALDELGLAPQALHRVVLTHFHDDHVGAAAEIRAWGEVEVVAHEADAPVISGQAAAAEPKLDDDERALLARLTSDVPPAPPVPVDRQVGDGAELDFGGGAQVISVPGHTAGSIALYRPAHRTLFTGDAVAEQLGRVVPGAFNTEPERVAESVRRLAELDVDVALFGHGEPALHNAGARLREAVAVL